MIRRPPRSTLFPYTSSSDLLLAQEGLGVVGAHYRIPDESGWVARVWYGEQESEKQGDISYVPAGDLLVTRATFERAGGGDEPHPNHGDWRICPPGGAARVGAPGGVPAPRGQPGQ